MIIMKLNQKNCSVRMSQELYSRTKDISIRAGITVGESIRNACRQFNERDAQVENAKKILLESPKRHMQLIRFASEGANHKSKIRLYIHEDALCDLNGIEEKEKADKKIMEFMRESISDGTLFSKGEVKTSDGSNIILFRVHLFDVYCHFGPAQITILSVS